MTASHVAQPAAISIGNFDGVHCGHAALVAAARACVGEWGRVIVLAFDPHPSTALRPNATPVRLSTFAQRNRWLKELGVDEVHRLDPTPEFLQQSPEQFIAACVDRWHPSAIVEGADFRFGRARAGSVATLRELESQFDYQTIVVEPVEAVLANQSIVRVSSSLARWLLLRGRVQDAARLLGRPYEINGLVQRGDQRGRTLGFPTVNLGSFDQLIPADGIYAGFAQRIHERQVIGEWPAAISVGTKPTFGDNPRTCEAHLLDYDGPVNDYDWNIRLHFTHWLRDQLTYPNLDALIVQLHHDIAAVRAHAQPGTGGTALRIARGFCERTP